MKITNEFTVHTPIERAWQVLTDLEGIAPCMPGARLTGVEGDTYQGKVKVKVGPVISEFAGTARFAERDEAGYRAVIDAKGRDARAGGNAAALVTAVLTPAGESTRVSVDTDLKISGKLAQFGSGMIKEVSGKLLTQFVTNLEAKLATGEAEPAAGTADQVDQVAPVPATSDQAASAPAASDQAASAPAASDQAAVAESASAQADPGRPEAGEGVSDHAEPDKAPSDRAGSDQATSGRAGSEPAASVQKAPEPVSPVREATPAASSAPRPVAADEPEPLDLLSVAGSSIYKRAIPVVAAVVVIGAVIAWAVARR